MAQTLEAMIEREYEQVDKERKELLAKRDEIDEQLRALERRLEAASNYKATLEGKFAAPQRTRTPRSTARAGRGDRAKLREQILDLLRKGELTAEVINNELPSHRPEGKTEDRQRPLTHEAGRADHPGATARPVQGSGVTTHPGSH